jgi:hypothetical protein
MELKTEIEPTGKSLADSTKSQYMEHCKYCLQNSIENTSQFITPCNCTNPVCINCLRIRVESDKKLKCELCLEDLQITPDMRISIDPPENSQYTDEADNYVVDVRDHDDSDRSDGSNYDIEPGPVAIVSNYQSGRPHSFVNQVPEINRSIYGSTWENSECGCSKHEQQVCKAFFGFIVFMCVIILLILALVGMI